MSNDADIANEFIERELNALIKAARGVIDDDPVIRITCIDCGETIPPERRRLVKNVKRCADCQHYFENKL